MGIGSERRRSGKALFFLNSFTGGGAEKVCLNLARQLHRMGIESDFVTVYNTEADFEIPDYVHICSLGTDAGLSWIKRFLQLPGNLYKVNTWIAGSEYVLMTAHLPMAQVLASCTKAGKRCLYVMHVTQHLTDRQNSPLYRAVLWIFLRGKRMVTVSKGLEYELVNEYGMQPDHVTTIYNPCAVSVMKAQIQTDSPHRRSYILVLGRLEEQKNPLLALELYVKGEFFHSHDLVYLGKGSLEGDLRKKIREYHLQSCVYLMGFQKNIVQWLKHASLLLSCSRQEGLPLNLAEALICGTPVVAADCPYGPDEILTGELAGYLINPDREFRKSISTVASALRSYPDITEEIYGKFRDEIVTQKYLDVWKRWMGHR